MEQASVTFPGLPAIVPAARRLVRGVLAGTPRAGDVELIACELIANSIRHTPSGGKGGEFTVSVSGGSGWSRVEVSDAGTGQWNLPDGSQPDDDAEYGRGLAIVAALADKLGHDATPEGQTLWAEVHWADAGKVAPHERPDTRPVGQRDRAWPGSRAAQVGASGAGQAGASAA